MAATVQLATDRLVGPFDFTPLEPFQPSSRRKQTKHSSNIDLTYWDSLVQIGKACGLDISDVDQAPPDLRDSSDAPMPIADPIINPL